MNTEMNPAHLYKSRDHHMGYLHLHIRLCLQKYIYIYIHTVTIIAYKMMELSAFKFLIEYLPLSPI
jgi:hypothetical protein